MNWRSPRLLLLLAGIIVLVVSLCVVVIFVFHAGHTQRSTQYPVAQKTVIPGNERQVVQTYNQAGMKQDWATVYASTALSARGGYTQEEFSQLMTQQEKTEGTIVSITPNSNPQVKTNADYITYFTVFEKVTLVKNGISQTSTYAFIFILENGSWKFFTSKKI